MKQSGSIKQALLKVDTQAGYLRLALWVISLFILWSLLAYIASIANPLPTLPDLWPAIANSGNNLAADLWRDILGNYFSPFTLLNLALALLLAQIAFSGAVYLLTRSLRLSDAKSAQRFLRSCLFSLREYPLVNTTDPDYQKSDPWKILTGIGGPCYLLLEPDSAVLMEDNSGYAQVVFPKDEADNILFFQHGEKAIQIIPARPLSISLRLRGINRSSHSLDWRNLRMRCKIEFEENSTQPGKNNSLAEALRQNFSLPEHSWEEKLEALLELESRAFLLNFASADIREAFGIEKPAGTQMIDAHPGSLRTHHIARHGRLYVIPGRFFQWKKQGGFLRRRRRSLLPELRVLPIQELTPEPPALDFKTELRQFLSGAFKTIYNIPINIEIENIGEIQFNGEN